MGARGGVGGGGEMGLVMFVGYSEDESFSARFETAGGRGGNHGVGGTPRRSAGGKRPTITPHAYRDLRVYSGAVLAHGAGSGAGRQPALGRRSGGQTCCDPGFGSITVG